MAPGNDLSFALPQIGRAQEFFPYFVVAFREINRLGRRGTAFQAVTQNHRLEACATDEASNPVGQPSRPSTHKTVELRRIDLLDPLTGAATPVYDAADNLVHPLRTSLA